MKTRLIAVAGTFVASMFAIGVSQASVLYANNAGTPYVESFDTTDGSLVNRFVGSGGNGRGVVVVGDVVYTTDANTGFIGTYDRTSGASLGGFTARFSDGTALGGMSTIGYDGDNFWTSDYTGGNNAYYLDGDTGEVLKTITLERSQGFYDGLEYFNGKLIANRFDGGFTGGNQYSIYDTDGNLLSADFIDTTGYGNGTGIAFDGTNFYIADIFNERATIWDGMTGGYLGALEFDSLTNTIEDLSFDYESREDTCRENCNGDPVSVPEPASLPVFGIGLLGLWASRRLKKTS